ncbi:hypothetical protein M422DRAFT_37979, partial [Sphaerobolus stellatus SS14]
SYPSPTLSNETLLKLHSLAALVPPEEGTPEFATLKEEVEDLVRVVEAVRVAPDSESAVDVREQKEGVPSPTDARIWPKDVGVRFQDEKDLKEFEESGPPKGRELLKLSERTKGEFYVVDSSKMKV